MIGSDVGQATRAGARGDQLADRARAVFPGGFLGSFTFPKHPMFIAERGLGSKLWNVDGVEFLDFVCGSGPLISGHSNPAVVAAVRAQLDRGSTYYVLNEAAIELAEAIVGAVPCADLVRLCSSGAEATFYALRLARAFTGKTKIMKLDGAYHGHHDYAMFNWKSPLSNSRTPVADSSGIPAAVAETVLVGRFNETDETCQMIRDHAKDLAAVIVEPVQRVIPPEPGFLQALREVTREHGVLLIFDEVVTGFYLAWGGAQEHFGVTPDLATYGKAIGSGYPVAAVAGRREVLELSDSAARSGRDLAYVSGTLNGNPIGAAAGVANLGLLRQTGTYQHLWRLAARLRDGFADLARTAGIPAQFAGYGPLGRFAFTAEPATRVEVLRRQDSRKAEAFHKAMFEHRVLLNPEKVYISLAHSDSDIDRALDACDASLRSL